MTLPAESSKPERNLSILVVEDDENLRTSIVSSLDLAGYVVSATASPFEALEFVRNRSFDIVLCDLRLPEMDGLAFIKECHTIAPDLAIILMTAFGSTDLAIEAMRAGAY